MDRLDTLEAQSIYILREACATARPLAMLWSIGKDSNVVIWLARKAFFGRVPFPVVQLDTAMELDEVYAYRDRYVKEWDLDLVVIDCPPESEMDPDLPPMTRAAALRAAGRALPGRAQAHQGPRTPQMGQNPALPRLPAHARRRSPPQARPAKRHEPQARRPVGRSPLQDPSQGVT